MSKKNKIQIVEENSGFIRYIDFKSFDELHVRGLLTYNSDEGDCWIYSEKYVKIIDKIIKDCKRNNYGNTIYSRKGNGFSD